VVAAASSAGAYTRIRTYVCM